MKYCFSLLFLFTIIISCKEVEHVVIQNEDINIEQSAKEYTAKDIFTDFQLVPLQTDSAGMYRSASKIIIHNDNYYILDKLGRKQILAFDEYGTFSNTFGHIGKGKGEYTNILDFAIDEENERLVILAYPSTVLVYDMNGNFSFSKKIDENTMLWSIINTEDGFICSTNHMTYTEGEHAFLLYFYDKDFNLIEKNIPVLKKQMQIPSFIATPLMNCTNGTYMYFDTYTAVAYLIDTENEITISQKNIKLGNPMPTDAYADYKIFATKQHDHDFFIKAVNIDNTLLAFYTNNSKIKGIKTNLETKNVSSFNCKGWMPEMLYHKDGVIYGTISPKQVLANKDLFKPEHIDMIKNNHNECIIKFKYKEKK